MLDILSEVMNDEMRLNDINDDRLYLSYSAQPTMCRMLSFARTAYSFTCSALLTLLVRSATLIRSLARSLAHSGAHGKVIRVYGMNASISYSLKPLCRDPIDGTVATMT